MRNLLETAIPEKGESFHTLLENGALEVELIVSSETPEPLLYDQERDEAVLLLEGEALLWLDGEEIVMRRGDFLCIRAHTPHRVLRTRRGTRWLAIHAKEKLC